MDIETLSDRILDEGFGLGEISHLDETPSNLDDDISEVAVVKEDNSEEPSSDDDDILLTEEDDSDSLEHYGVKGMRWGIRKDRKSTTSNKKEKRRYKDRRYGNETNAEYEKRMQREQQVRMAKIESKERMLTQKRALKSQEKLQKAQLKSLRKQAEANAKAQQKAKEMEINERIRQEKARKQEQKEAERKAKKAAREQTESKPTNVRNLSDRELNDAIQRLRNEQTYKQLSLQNKAFPKRTVIKAATIGGGILLAVGTAVAKKQLTDVGNQKASDFLTKKGLLKVVEDKGKGKGKGPSIDDFNDLVDVVNELKEQLGR